MSNSWIEDVDESEEEEEREDSEFVKRLQKAIDDGMVSEMPDMEFIEGIHEIEDVELLSIAHAQLEDNGHPEMEVAVSERLNNLESDDGEEESEKNTPNQNKAPETTLESISEMDDDSPMDDDETSQKQSSSVSEDSGGIPEPEGSISVKEAANRERRWKMMVWGPPGLFKSHFCYTAPEPIAYIDTEQKADDIAHKFQEKEIQIWQPEGFREAQDALREAIEWLDYWREEEDTVGTIVVDSMSVVWDWAKWTYKVEKNPMTPEDELDDVPLSSNIGSSKESDWSHIKGMHNGEFRAWMIESPYHLVWTASETEDYAATISGEADVTPMKPSGEKDNDHNADTIIRGRKDDNGVKVGDLTKSNFSDHLFRGLERPTYGKVTEAINAIEEAENDEDVSKSEVEEEIGADVVRGDPTKFNKDD